MNPPEISALAARSGLDRIWRKVETAERLSRDDVTALLASPDLLALGAMADFARARSAGDEVYFISNRHINHTNVCRNRCLFCAFSHDEGDAGPATRRAVLLTLRGAMGGMRLDTSSFMSAATRFRRQIATGSGWSPLLSSTRLRRQAGSHGRSQVRPRMPGNTLDTQLIM